MVCAFGLNFWVQHRLLQAVPSLPRSCGCCVALVGLLHDARTSQSLSWQTPLRWYFPACWCAWDLLSCTYHSMPVNVSGSMSTRSTMPCWWNLLQVSVARTGFPAGTLQALRWGTTLWNRVHVLVFQLMCHVYVGHTADVPCVRMSVIQLMCHVYKCWSYS